MEKSEDVPVQVEVRGSKYAQEIAGEHVKAVVHHKHVHLTVHKPVPVQTEKMVLKPVQQMARHGELVYVQGVHCVLPTVHKLVHVQVVKKEFRRAVQMVSHGGPVHSVAARSLKYVLLEGHRLVCVPMVVKVHKFVRQMVPHGKPVNAQETEIYVHLIAHKPACVPMVKMELKPVQ